MQLTQEWDKTFPKSDKVDHQKVTFKNRYGITLAADLYLPKNRAGERLPALAVGGPFGAVKEQSSGLYAQTMAERGFVTLAFDPSYTGESGGEPRNVASPDINTEDFSAAVDFLGLHPSVDRERIGIIGICGWGGMALECRRRGQARQGRRRQHHVRHDARDVQRLQRQRDPRAAHANAGATEPAALAGCGKGNPGLPAALQRAERRRGAVPGRLPRLLQDAARLPPASGQLGQLLDASPPRCRS